MKSEVPAFNLRLDVFDLKKLTNNQIKISFWAKPWKSIFDRPGHRCSAVLDDGSCTANSVEFTPRTVNEF